MRRLGVFEIDTFFPPADRTEVSSGRDQKWAPPPTPHVPSSQRTPSGPVTRTEVADRKAGAPSAPASRDTDVTPLAEPTEIDGP